jgi:hypothetical protein
VSSGKDAGCSRTTIDLFTKNSITESAVYEDVLS